MNLNVSVAHTQAREAVRARLETVARERGASIEADASGDPHSGTLEKKLGFLGHVRARFTISVTSVEFTVFEAPFMLGEARLRALIEVEIGRELARIEGGGPA